MIIGIDGNEANTQTRVGVSWYVYHLLWEFSKLQGPRFALRVFLKDPPREDLPPASKHFKYQIVRKRSLWSQIDLPLALSIYGHDLKLFFAPAHYAPRFCPCPTVVAVHDLSYFYYPQDFLPKDLYQLEHWTGYSVRFAKKVVAVSEVTKQDLIKNYGVPASKIKVIHNGFSQSNAIFSEPSFKVRKPYFVYLGTLQPRKNIHNLLSAFIGFKKTHPEYTLYLVGKKGWLYESLLEFIKKRHLEESVIVTDYISEDHKNWLLRQATSLIIPGLYEGFGLPVLEGFAAKIPVLASNTGALSEVAEAGALYFDPTKVNELQQQMERIVKEDTLREELVRKGTLRLKQFSWSKTAQELTALFQEL